MLRGISSRSFRHLQSNNSDDGSDIALEQTEGKARGNGCMRVPAPPGTARRDVLKDKAFVKEQAETFVSIGATGKLDYLELVCRYKSEAQKEGGASSWWMGQGLRGWALRRSGARERRKIDIMVSFFIKIFADLLPPLGIGLLAYSLSLRDSHRGDLEGMSSAHRLLGIIVSITMGFKNKSAYDRFVEGQKIVSVLCQSGRELVMGAYSSIPMDEKDQKKKDKDKGKDKDKEPTWLEVMWAQAGVHTLTPPKKKDEVPLDALAWEVRRRVMVLLAFIRQAVRESRKGFMPQSVLASAPFTPESYVYDPVVPRLQDMLTGDEYERYKSVDARQRPFLVAGEIQCMVQAFGLSIIKYSDFNRSGVKYITTMMDSYEAMLRIRDTKVVRPYSIVMYISMCLFIYATPFVYTLKDQTVYKDPWRGPAVLVLLLTEFLVLFFFGIASIGSELENPFGYGLADLPLEETFKNVHDDCLSIAKDLGGDQTSFVPPGIPPETIPCKSGMFEQLYNRLARAYRKMRYGSLAWHSRVSRSLMRHHHHGGSEDRTGPCDV